ncbi:MAG TPA: helix-turn-helix domain-containing protein [Pseudonocardiaceae bacterium]|jgi:AcrR family transcriptional regulator|nr:helix-turn-helix domain-containing protein [Pseudonocardiaceae bacterium]
MKPTEDAGSVAGPKRRLSADDRRAEIVAVARRLFAESGFDATTTREIATAAGISDALIYRHFSGKEALLQAIVDDGIARFSTLGPPPGVDPSQVPLSVLLAGTGRAFLAALAEQRDLIQLLISQHHVLAADTRFVEFIDSAATTLGAVIDRRHPLPGGSTEPGRGHLLARGFMGSLVAFAILQHSLGMDAVRKVDPDAYLLAMASTLVAGLEAESTARASQR